MLTQNTYYSHTQEACTPLPVPATPSTTHSSASDQQAAGRALMYRSAPRMCTSRNDCPRRTTCNPNNSLCSPRGLGAGFAKYHTGTGRACQRSLFLWRGLGSSGRAADLKSIPASSAVSLPSLVVCYNHLSQPPPHLAKGTRRGRTNICFAFCQDKQPALESVTMYRQSLSAHYSLASHY